MFGIGGAVRHHWRKETFETLENLPDGDYVVFKTRETGGKYGDWVGPDFSHPIPITNGMWRNEGTAYLLVRKRCGQLSYYSQLDLIFGEIDDLITRGMLVEGAKPYPLIEHNPKNTVRGT